MYLSSLSFRTGLCTVYVQGYPQLKIDFRYDFTNFSSVVFLLMIPVSFFFNFLFSMINHLLNK